MPSSTPPQPQPELDAHVDLDFHYIPVQRTSPPPPPPPSVMDRHPYSPSPSTAAASRPSSAALALGSERRSLDAPVPMTIPALLRNPRPKQTTRDERLHRYGLGSHRVGGGSAAGAGVREREMGKRTRRRWENDRLAGNPYAVRPSARDLAPPSYNQALPTFPSPPPPYLPRTVPTPSGLPAEYERLSAEAGQFNLGLKGVRKALRRRGAEPGGAEGGGIVEAVLRLAEVELRGWLDGHAVWIHPSLPAHERQAPRVIDNTPYLVPTPPRGATAAEARRAVEQDEGEPTLVEMSRSPSSLAWYLPDPFLRFAVHCLARYYGCPSFSKPPPSAPGAVVASTERWTWILNPNPLARAPPRPAPIQAPGSGGEAAATVPFVRPIRPIRIDGGGASGLETPPMTDLDAGMSSDQGGDGGGLGSSSRSTGTNDSSAAEDSESVADAALDDWRSEVSLDHARVGDEILPEGAHTADSAAVYDDFSEASSVWDADDDAWESDTMSNSVASVAQAEEASWSGDEAREVENGIASLALKDRGRGEGDEVRSWPYTAEGGTAGHSGSGPSSSRARRPNLPLRGLHSRSSSSPSRSRSRSPVQPFQRSQLHLRSPARPEDVPAAPVSPSTAASQDGWEHTTTSDDDAESEARDWVPALVGPVDERARPDHPASKPGKSVQKRKQMWRMPELRFTDYVFS